jgi:hypothetical protein
MDEELRWMLELKDKMTGPAAQMSRGVMTLSKRLQNGTQATFKFNTGLTAATKSAKGGAAGFWGLGAAMGGWVSAAQGAIGVAGALGSAVMKLGEGIAGGLQFGVEQMAFRESTMASFRLMEGTVEGARSMYDQAIKMAVETPFQIGEVLDAFKQLRAAGFSRADVPEMFKGLGDIAAASGFEGGLMDRIVTQLAQVKSLGRLQMVDYKVITSNMAKAGVGIAEVNQQIAKAMGIGASEVLEVMGQGAISADIGIKAIFDAIAAKNGQLGAVMETMSGTLTGQFERLKDIPGAIFLTLDRELGDMPGMKAFKGAVENVIKLFDVASDTGREFQSAVADVFDSVIHDIFGPLSGDEGFGNMRKILRVVLGQLRIFWGFLKGMKIAATAFFETIAPSFKLLSDESFWDPKQPELFVNTFKKLGEEAGKVATAIIEIARAVGTAIETWSRWEKKLDKLEYYGNMMAAGVQFGMTGNLPGLLLAGKALVQGPAEAVKKEAQIHSPSRLFEGYGQRMTEGLALGLAPSGLSAAGAALVPGAPAAAAGRAGRAISVALTIQVDNGGHADGDTLAKRLGELLPTQVAALFEQMNLELGEA